jgi:hypothetical protein
VARNTNMGALVMSQEKKEKYWWLAGGLPPGFTGKGFRTRQCPCGTTFTVDPLDNDYLRCPPCRIKLHKPKKPRRAK